MKMADCTTLLRYLLKDRTELMEALNDCYENNTVFISNKVLVEAVNTLETVHEFSKNQIVDALEKLIEHENVHVYDKKLIHQSLEHYRNGNEEFFDALLEECCAKEHFGFCKAEK